MEHKDRVRVPVLQEIGIIHGVDEGFGIIIGFYFRGVQLGDVDGRYVQFRVLVIGGNVGIGGVNPAYKLNVDGTLNVNSTSRVLPSSIPTSSGIIVSKILGFTDMLFNFQHTFISSIVPNLR